MNGNPQKAIALFTAGSVLSVEWEDSWTVGEKSSH